MHSLNFVYTVYWRRLYEVFNISVFATLFCYIPLQNNSPSLLTHWGRATHICVSKQTIIGSYNGLSPGRRQAIIWANAGTLLIIPWGTKFSEILIGIQTFSFKKINLKMSFAKWRPFCRGLNVVNPAVATPPHCYIYRGVLVSVMKGTLAPPRIYFMAAAALTYDLNKVGVVLIWKQCNRYVCCVKINYRFESQIQIQIQIQIQKFVIATPHTEFK